MQKQLKKSQPKTNTSSVILYGNYALSSHWF